MNAQSDGLNIRLSEIAQCVGEHATLHGTETDRDILIPRVSTDSRQLTEGQLFVAIEGERFDGHSFLGDAKQKGACAAVISEDRLGSLRAEMSDFPLIVVRDTLKALQNLAHYHRTRFSIPMVALTGSVGKTTAKEYIASVLATRYTTLKSQKSFNNPIGVPLTLLELRQGHEIAVLEMGTSDFGEIATLCRIAEPDYGVILNIAEAHLEFFGSLEGVLKAKLELFEGLVGDRVGIYNVDDPILARQKMPTRRCTTFGLGQAADVRGSLKDLDECGRVCFSIEETDVRLQIPGEHNVYNALAGAAVGREFGIPFKEIKEGLESVKGVAGRVEMRQKADVRIIDDVYNSNLRSANAALVLLSRLKVKRSARRFAVLADMLELGETTEYAHRKVGELCVENGIDFLFVHGEASQYTIDSARSKGHKNSWHFEDKQALLNKLGQMVREGDVVLVKGSRRMKMEDIVEGLLMKLETEEG